MCDLVLKYIPYITVSKISVLIPYTKWDPHNEPEDPNSVPGFYAGMFGSRFFGGQPGSYIVVLHQISVCHLLVFLSRPLDSVSSSHSSPLDSV